MRIVSGLSIILITLFAYFSFVSSASASAVNTCPPAPFQALCLGPGAISTATGNIIALLLVLAVILAIIFLIWGGVKWITAGGDKAAIESARSTIIAAIVGLVLAFAAFFIFNLLLYLFGLSGTSFKIPQLI